MADKFAHVNGCNCASCKEINRVRNRTGDKSWDHKVGCDCSECRKIENLRRQAEISNRGRGK